jgi:hypothetical protein
VLPEVARATAEKTAMIIPLHRARTLGHFSGTQETTMDSEPEPPETTKPQVNDEVDLGFESAPSGTRTPNPLLEDQLLPVVWNNPDQPRRPVRFSTANGGPLSSFMALLG